MTETNFSDIPTCVANHSGELEHFEELQQEALEPERAQQMADFFRLLGDSNRLRIISLLAKQDLCVCDLAALLSMSESSVSHQLKTLRSLRLVSYAKRGRKVYYRLRDCHMLELYRLAIEHLAETDL